MDFDTFQRRARQIWEAIPARYRVGVSTLVVDPGIGTQETSLGTERIYGCCEDDPVVMSLPHDEVVSRITLFHGSFVVFAEEDPDFDWEHELWETLRHELEHHLGARAGHDPRADEDAAEHEHERMLEGHDFTPGYHRAGTPLGGGAYLLAHDLLVEVDVPARRWQELATHGWQATWEDLAMSVPPLEPEALASDPLYVDADWDAPDDLRLPWEAVVLVLRRKRSWWPWG
ncbi:MAG: metallopeptidase family protein [Alphaproteobacteria bacterium]|nr:metallopeptidase family protein [Alphaproteobacteria bacterium]